MLIPMSSYALVCLLAVTPQGGKLLGYSVRSQMLSQLDSNMVDLFLKKEMKSIDGFLALRDKDVLKIRIVDVDAKRYFMFFNTKATEVVVFVVSDLSSMEDVRVDRIINRAFGVLRDKEWGLSHTRRGRRFESQGGIGTYEDIRTAIGKGAAQADSGLVAFHK